MKLPTRLQAIDGNIVAFGFVSRADNSRQVAAYPLDQYALSVSLSRATHKLSTA